MASWETFKLSELRLDQRNYRTGPAATQRDALAAIIDDQKGKLVNLAEDILSVGLSPGEPIWVTRDSDAPGMYVVVEGNRRLAALKLLETPTLADGTVVERAFSTLAKQYAENPMRELEARVFASREEALPWQRRRHMSNASGVGIVRWEALAKARASRDQGVKAPRFLAVVDFLEDESDEWQGLQDVLDSKWTTVDRVLNASTLPTVLGIEINPKTGSIKFENGDAEAGKELLRRILHEIARPEFKFAEIETDRDRESFVSRFAGMAVKATTAAPDSAGQADSPTPPAAAPARLLPRRTSARLTTPARTTLAPKNGPKTFRVDGDRLLSLYRECRLIPVQGNENAAALLLRVFIELSSEALLAEKGIPIPSSAKGKTSWDDFGITLATKVKCVLDYLDNTGRAKTFQQARLALDPNSQTTSSITTLHGYFHNRHLRPDVIALREAWDAWESYLRQLHAAR